MRAILAAVYLAATLSVIPAAGATLWGPAIPGVPPGGFATITVDGVRHGERNVPPQLKLRVTTSKVYTAIVVRLDGVYVDMLGRPVVGGKHTDIPQWDFVETQVHEVDLKGLAPGVHHLEIRRGVSGSSLPLVNEHEMWFSVGE